jgi:hypothetical protein
MGTMNIHKFMLSQFLANEAIESRSPHKVDSSHNFTAVKIAIIIIIINNQARSNCLLLISSDSMIVMLVCPCCSTV